MLFNCRDKLTYGSFIMLKQHALLSLALVALMGSTYSNAAPIESRGLSQGSGVANEVGASPIAGNMNWDLIQKNQQLENQIRELRGKIEEHDHQIDQLNKELSNRYTDLDQRLELINQKLDPEPADAHTDSDGSTDTQNNTPSPEPQTTAPTEQSNQTNSPANPQAANQSIELEKAAYTIALDAYKQGGAKKAIAPMQNFVKSYPESIYTGNAYFWLAEFNLAIEPPNYNEAKKHYETVASRFPNSSKAPRALYQLYNIAKEVNKNTASANVYKNKLLNTYPKSEEAGFVKKV